MRRRDFLTVLAGATTCASTVHGQEPRRVIGVLSSMFHDSYPGTEDAFVKGLKKAGFVEGRNVSIECRWADGHYDRLPSLNNGDRFGCCLGCKRRWQVERLNHGYIAAYELFLPARQLYKDRR